MAAEPVKETIKLSLDSSGIPKNSLAALITQLEQVEAKWKSLETMINGTNASLAKTPRQVAEIQMQLRKAQAAIAPQGGSGFKASAIAQALGADAAAFEKHLASIKKGVEGYHKTIQEFRNIPSAARAFAGFESASYRNLQKQSVSMRDLLRPTVSSVHGTGQLKVEGVIPLAIPAAQVQASVIGPIQIAIPGDQIVVTGVSAGAASRDAGGKFTGGGGGGGRRRSKGGGKAFSDNDLKSVMGYGGSVVLRQDLLSGAESATVTTLHEAGQTLATTFEKIEGSLKESKRVTRRPGGLTPLQQFQQARRLVTAGFQTDVLNLNPSDLGYGLSGLYAKQATQLKGLLPPELAKQITPAKAKAIQAELDAGAARLQAQSAEASLMGDVRSDRLRRTGRAYPMESYPGQAGLAVADLRKNERIEEQRRREEMRQQRQEEKPSRFQKAVNQSFTPEGFATHMVKVAGWAAAVTVLYKSWEMVEYSMRRVLDVGMQMSHLQVIFKQQGGSVKELTDDILSLAAAQGRSTDEAMESATEWARLGLTRSQTNEAVKVSMVAANVAQMHTTETTKQLMSLMHIYHLQVTDLNAELGKLVYTSQHYNVTLEDLFQGLDRAAPQARQMGMSLAELQGIIAGTVGKTGQSGVVVGNTIKYVLQEFNRVPIQTMLRGYGIETSTSTGEMKNSSQIMRELFVRYQGLNGTERQSLTTQLAGRFHGARFVGMMDSYLESQKLAIDSQLHLNSAQTANAAILDTLQNKLSGLKSEWDRFVFSQSTTPTSALGGFTPMQLLTGAVGGFSNTMKFMDDHNQSIIGPTAASLGIGAGLYTLGRSRFGLSAAAIAKKSIGSRIAGSLIGRGMMSEGMAALLGGELLTGPVGWLAAAGTMALPFAGQLGAFLGDRAGGGRGGDVNFRGDSWGDLSRMFASRGSAAAMKGQLFQTTLDLLSVKNPDKLAMGNISSAIGLSASEMAPSDSKALNSAFASGDMATVRRILSGQMQSQNSESMTDVQKQAIADKQNLIAKQSQLEELQSKLEVPTTFETRRNAMGMGSIRRRTGGMTDEDRSKTEQQVKDLTGVIQELNRSASDSQELLEEAVGTPPEELSRKQEYISLLKQEQEIIQQIGQLSEQGGSGTPADRLSAQIQSAQMQVDLTKSTYERLQQYVMENPAGVEAVPARDEALKQYQDAQGQYNSLNSPRVRALADLEENRGIIYRRTDIENQGVGYTETEKMQNQRDNLNRDLSRISAIPESQRTPEDNARAYRDSVDLKTTEVRLAERLVELRKQERQIMLDAGREFQKSLLLAGPGELLKKLYVSQVSNRRDPMSTGEFMSWDPEMRQMFYNLHGGEAGARNREEQYRINLDPNVPRTAKGEIDQSLRDQQQVDKWRGRVGRDTMNSQNGLPALPLPFEQQAKTASVQIGILGSAAMTTASILSQVNSRLAEFMELISGGRGRTRPGASFGIAPGFSLGGNNPLSVWGGIASSLTR